MSSTTAPRYGSDLIVDLLIQAGIEHIAFNPGASFRGLHDSLVHRPDAPKLALAMHESVAVAMAQGYAKAAGKPMAVLLHNVVGLQNASMSIYNAWCDRVPMMLLGGTGPKATGRRRPWIDWIHTASVQANIIRDFVKWDDEPHDLGSVEESFARALAATKSVPHGPVYLCYDVDLQEDKVPEDFVPVGIDRFAVPSAPAPSRSDVVWLLEALRCADRPLILAGYVGEAEADFAALTELAEALGAPVVDTGVRHAFPTSHPLAGMHIPDLVEHADVVLALDVEDLHTTLRTRFEAGNLKLLNVSLSNLKLRSWAHDHQAMVPAQRFITADANEVVKALLAELRVEPLPADKVAARSTEISARTADARAHWRLAASTSVAERTVPLDRLLWELSRALDGVDYVLGGATNGRHEHKYLSLDRARQYTGWGAGGGLGYGVSGAIGTALAQGPGTVTVDVQADGDLLFLPSALWTAARLRLPVLVVVNNNRQYGNTVEHAMSIAARRGQDDSRRYVGAGLDDPPVDLAAMARSFGVWAEGPVSDVDTLTRQLEAAVAVVRSGRPALLDVLTPGF